MSNRVQTASLECEGSGSYVGTAVAAAAGSVEVVIEILIEAALGVGRCETRTGLPDGRAAEAVAANEIVHKTTAMRQEHAVLAEGELIDAADYKDLSTVCVVGTEADPGITSEDVIVGITERPRPGVVDIELKPLGEALVELRLQGVIACIG